MAASDLHPGSNVVSASCQYAQMASTDSLLSTPDDQSRAHLLELIGAIEPWDHLERTHLGAATQWIMRRSSALPGAQAGCSGDALGELFRRP